MHGKPEATHVLVNIRLGEEHQQLQLSERAQAEECVVEMEQLLDRDLATGGLVDGGDDSAVGALAEGVQDAVVFADAESDLGLGGLLERDMI